MKALTLDRSTHWPTAAQLVAFGSTRQIASPALLKQILAQTAEAMHETMADIRTYMRDHAELSETGRRMLVA